MGLSGMKIWPLPTVLVFVVSNTGISVAPVFNSCLSSCPARIRLYTVFLQQIVGVSAFVRSINWPLWNHHKEPTIECISELVSSTLGSRLSALTMKSATFCVVTPRVYLKVNRRFGGTSLLFSGSKPCLPPALTLVSFAAYSSTVKMEVTCSLETSIDSQYLYNRLSHNYFPVYCDFRVTSLSEDL
jgi:hypothetical protein